MGNNFLYGIQIMVIGMGVVFAGLLILSYVMVLLNRFFGVKEKPVKQDQPVTGAISPGPTSESTAESPDQIPAEVVAVITSSIAAYLDTAPAGVRIRVVRRQIPLPLSSWSMAGRQEQMNQRQMG
ncbi:MAG: OadG family protein [bacterium]|jgi:sodium pump decarboxylase gamma subunit